MKTKFKILLMALGLTLFVTQSQAQAIRFETMVNPIVQPEYDMVEWGAGFAYEQFITRNISLSTGAMFKMLEDPMGRYSYDNGYLDDYDYENDWGHGVEMMRVSVPLIAEYKYLLSNRVRVYANTGLLFNVNIEDHLGSSWSGATTDINKFNLGYTVGAGFEFGAIRLGFTYDTDITNVGEYNGSGLSTNTFAFIGGIRFGGNKLLRTKSKAMTASVSYPILEPETAPATKQAPKKAAAPAPKASVAPVAAKKETAQPVVAKEESTVVAAQPVAAKEPKQKSESSAETLSYLRVGMNLAKTSNEYSGSDYDNMRKLGYYVGYGFQKPITISGVDNLYWGAEFALTTRGYKEEYYGDGYSEVESLQAHNIQVSPNVGYKYKLPISKQDLTLDVHLGLCASYDYAGKFVDECSDGDRYEETITEANEWSKDEYGERAYNRYDIGIAYGFGVWYNSKYNVDFSFQNGFINPYYDTSYKYKNRNFMIRLGYAF